MALAPDFRSPPASVATGARPGSAKHEHGGLATARQQGDGVTFAFFCKRHDSPAVGGYSQASTTKAAAGFYALWSLRDSA